MVIGMGFEVPFFYGPYDLFAVGGDVVFADGIGGQQVVYFPFIVVFFFGFQFPRNCSRVPLILKQAGKNQIDNYIFVIL
jgi:hypothetical protein